MKPPPSPYPLRPSRGLAAWCVCASLLAPSPRPARAEPPIAQVAAPELGDNPPEGPARRLFEDGVARAEARHFADAATAFSASFHAGPSRAALFAWAQSERLAGRCAEAEALYRRFLSVAVKPEETQAAQIGLRRCEPRPPPTLRAAPSKPARPPVRSGSGERTGIIVASAGLALVAGGGALAVLAEADRRAAERATRYEDHRDARARAQVQGWAALAAGGAGIVTVALGIWLYARTPGAEPASLGQLHIIPLADGRRASWMAQWRGSF